MNTNEDQKSTDSSSDSDDEYENIHLTLKAVLAVVRCAAHTIQLAAHDVLKTIVEKVDECRKTVKIVRGIMRSTETNSQMPVLDNATRWNSTYFMIKSLFKIRNLIDNFEDGIPEVDWNFIIDFLSAFKPLAECTIKLQNEKYVIGDFFRDWLCCEIELEEIANSNNYANLLLCAMVSRKDKLFDNDAFIAALYVDPRFNFLNTPFLNEDQKKQAVRHLLKTNTFIKRLEGEAGAEQSRCEEGGSSSSSLPTSSRHFCKLEERTKSLLGAPTNSTEKTIKQKLGSLPYGERIPFDSDVLSYWSDLNHKDPHMGKLVEVVLATPCTQVSVERAFSALSTILTKLRSKLSKDTINNLLIVKLNNNIFDNISLVPSEDNM